MPHERVKAVNISLGPILKKCWSHNGKAMDPEAPNCSASLQRQQSLSSMSVRHPSPALPSDPPSRTGRRRGHLWLAVVLQRHCDDVDADDEGDDQVQVVAGAQSVDSQPGPAVRRVVWHLLGLWRERERKGEGGWEGSEDRKRGR